MQPTLQFLIAEHLQQHGQKVCEELANRFGKDQQSMRGTLRMMRAHGYITSDGGRPQIWAFATMPQKAGAVSHKERMRKRPHKAQTYYDGFNRPELSVLAALPVVRLA